MLFIAFLCKNYNIYNLFQVFGCFNLILYVINKNSKLYILIPKMTPSKEKNYGRFTAKKCPHLELLGASCPRNSVLNLKISGEAGCPLAPVKSTPALTFGQSLPLNRALITIYLIPMSLKSFDQKRSSKKFIGIKFHLGITSNSTFLKKNR